jgi:hypothetical protein
MEIGLQIVDQGRSAAEIHESISQKDAMNTLRSDRKITQLFQYKIGSLYTFDGIGRSLCCANGSPKPITLISERKELQQGRRNESNGQSYSPSIGRCLAFLLGCILGSLLLGLWGIIHLDDKRRFYGAAAISVAIVLYLGGWLVDLFPETFGRWL